MTGSYSTNGTLLMATSQGSSTPSTDGYCVSGDTLTIVVVAPDGGQGSPSALAEVVLTR